MTSEFLPTRETQIYQIFAANKNVGKTVVAAGLCRAVAILADECDRDVFYLKPFQTGYPIDSDERYVLSCISFSMFTYNPTIIIGMSRITIIIC